MTSLSWWATAATASLPSRVACLTVIITPLTPPWAAPATLAAGRLRTTLSATLPRNNRDRPRRPCVASAIRSESSFWAARRMPAAGWSSTTTRVCTGSDRDRSGAAVASRYCSACSHCFFSSASSFSRPTTIGPRPPPSRAYSRQHDRPHDAKQRELGARQPADLDGRLQDLFGEGRAVQRDQDALQVRLALQVRDAFPRTHQEHRHRQGAHQFVGHGAEPKAAEGAAAVRRHHHQIGGGKPPPRRGSRRGLRLPPRVASPPAPAGL